MGVFTNCGSKPTVRVGLSSLSQQFTNVVGVPRPMLANMSSCWRSFLLVWCWVGSMRWYPMEIGKWLRVAPQVCGYLFFGEGSCVLLGCGRWYRGHTKNPSSSSHQKHQPYVFSRNTWLGFQLAGATGVAGSLATNSSSQLKSQPCISREYIGLMFFAGPLGVALVWGCSLTMFGRSRATGLGSPFCPKTSSFSLSGLTPSKSPSSSPLSLYLCRPRHLPPLWNLYLPRHLSRFRWGHLPSRSFLFFLINGSCLLYGGSRCLCSNVVLLGLCSLGWWLDYYWGLQHMWGSWLHQLQRGLIFVRSATFIPPTVGY